MRIQADTRSEVTTEEVVSTLIHQYAQRRSAHHNVTGSEVLAWAYALAYDVSDEEANQHVGELLESIYSAAHGVQVTPVT